MLIMLVFIVGLAATAYFLHALNPVAVKIERDKKTAAALAEAKAALLGYAASRNLNTIACASASNCPRPGDLPCPDTNNDGVAESSCGNAAGTTEQESRLGRLPWKTLGLSDLRDGDGESLWYAVSNPYKYNYRYRPLNSDTLGTITLRDSSGMVIHDATAESGLVAIVIAPGSPLIRQDDVKQTRENTDVNDAINYLDIAFGEDNQDFIDKEVNGFVAGPVKNVDGSVVVNDRLLVIKKEEIDYVMETRTLVEVERAMLDYYCGIGNVNYSTKSCNIGGEFFPRPSDFTDASCLGKDKIETPKCLEGAATHGRIPANPDTPWDVNSILRGVSNSNWFQLNAWREVIYYAVAPGCATGTENCMGVARLTVNNAIVGPENTKKVVLIATGKAIGLQLRDSADKLLEESNYLEGENFTPLDDVYQRTVPISSSVNDRINSLP